MTAIKISRRAFGSIVAGGSSILLVGCLGNLTPAEVVNDLQTMATGLNNALTQLEKTNPNAIPAATAAKIQNDLTEATTVAGQLSTGMTSTAGATQAQLVLNDINAALTVLSEPPINGLIPSPFNVAVAAAAILAPSIEAYVTATIKTTAAASPGAVAVQSKAMASAPQIKTKEDARAVLKQFAASH
jgi:hypothetical protein